MLLSLLLAADEGKGESGVWEGKVVVGAWRMKDRTDKREFGKWNRKEEGKGDVGVFVSFCEVGVGELDVNVACGVTSLLVCNLLWL